MIKAYIQYAKHITNTYPIYSTGYYLLDSSDTKSKGNWWEERGVVAVYCPKCPAGSMQ